ncbi:RidA family protein [Alcaligenaceae bacterium]|nr:RidA family protein [Alcaligenaceae bacterium]
MTDIFQKRVHPSAAWSRDLFAEVVTVKGPGTTLYLSGIGAEALGARAGDIQHPGDVYAQTRLAYGKAAQVLAKHGASLADVVKITAYLLDARMLPEYHRARREAFEGLPPPAHTLLVIAALAWPGMLVEVDLTAVTGHGQDASRMEPPGAAG